MKRYDIADYAARVRAALDRLRSERQPGKGATTGGKAAVLRAERERIQGMLAEGYTVRELIEALSGVFPVQAKTIRAATRDGANTRRRARTQKSGARPGASTARAAAGAPSEPPASAPANPARTETQTDPGSVPAKPGARLPPLVPPGRIGIVEDTKDEEL